MRHHRFDTAKFFGVLLVGLAIFIAFHAGFAVGSSEDAILLKAATFTPPEAPNIPEDLRYTEHRSYYIVQLTEQITVQIRDDLLAAGVDFVGYVPTRCASACATRPGVT